MIEINDSDTPIDVAQKIVTATKTIRLSPTVKAIRKACAGIIGIERADENFEECEMFDLDEIREIADYLMVYCNSYTEKNE